MAKKGNGSRLLFLAIFLGIAASLTGAVFCGLTFQLRSAEAKRVPPGVFVEGIELSNLERQQATEKLNELEQALMNKQIQLRYQDKSWPMTLKELGFTVNVEDVLNQALQNDVNFLLRHIQAYFHPVKREITLSIGLNKEQLASALAPVVRAIERPAIDAKLVISDDGRVIMVPDQKGLKVNLDQAYTELLNTDIRQANIQLNLKVDELKAGKTLADIERLRINGKIGEFTTHFDAKNIDRTVNIRTAANRINGVILAPGQEFSFNKIVGERTSKAGYRPAAVIVANKFEEALGGGICQVSTTLYNAVLLANLTPVERHNHSLAIGYVPLGRDAAVAWNQLDFRFKNTLPGHVYLRTVVRSGSITVQVYGDTAIKKDVVVRSWVTETIVPDQVIKEFDPTLQPDEEVLVSPAYAGFRAKAERIIKENGAVIKKEALPDSYYHPRPKVVKVGRKNEEEKPQDAKANLQTQPNQPRNNIVETEY
ncbi:VanW family protein [Desulforamulus putei]|uniref:Vancomycin resistance protein YoaR, contains peptidoglycan-binding and VanW domains n=1 Tax=Desulforamulus putei DSM 12395 TaxID=1121429 RepID=A0A1M4Y9S9_9FIRM|nr:VanW family protein [Desulforamulus putei]SHF02366.1 Vancomycin resistance protein YoaR, contains peptidoglycan-binding and VanW domains [Desulforamulus putei DSM 12395]